MTTSIDDVTEAMKDVIDPELGINVIDLGLVYDMRLDENNIATLDMTLTSAACPLQDVIGDQTKFQMMVENNYARLVSLFSFYSFDR
jgi:metal-sulfur cluster biosynthetic enzyme